MTYKIVKTDGTIIHSAKGSSWKEHKYVSKSAKGKNGTFIYRYSQDEAQKQEEARKNYEDIKSKFGEISNEYGQLQNKYYNVSMDATKNVKAGRQWSQENEILRLKYEETAKKYEEMKKEYLKAKDDYENHTYKIGRDADNNETWAQEKTKELYAIQNKQNQNGYKVSSETYVNGKKIKK